MAAMAGWVCVLGFLGFVYLNTTRQLFTLEPRLEQARSENRRFKTFLADKRRQEKIRDSLLAQITVIRRVDGDRYIWPHLLDEVTKALPAYTWLVDLEHRHGSPSRRHHAGQGTKADSAAAAAAAAVPLDDVPAERTHHRHPGVYPVPPPAGGVALDRERDAGLRPDGCGEGTAGHRLQYSRQYTKADSAYIRTAPFSQSVR